MFRTCGRHRRASSHTHSDTELATCPKIGARYAVALCRKYRPFRGQVLTAILRLASRLQPSLLAYFLRNTQVGTGLVLKLRAHLPVKFTRMSFEETEWFTFNPSVFQFPSGKLAVVATRSNVDMRRFYRFGMAPITFGTPFWSSETDGDRKNALVIGELENASLLNTRKFVLAVRERPVLLAADRSYADARAYTSTQDVRLSWCESYPTRLEDGSTNRVGWGVLDAFSCAVTDQRSLKSPLGSSIEKNWMPVSNEPPLKQTFVYSISPTMTLDVDSSSPFAPVIKTTDYPSVKLEGYRGGTPLVPCGDGYLAVGHRTLFKPSRHYVHRFLHFSNTTGELQIDRFSPAFVFMSAFDIEFCSGLTIRDETVVLSFGYRDSQSWCALISFPELMRFVSMSGADTDLT